MTKRKRMIKGIVAAGAVLGGIDLFQDGGAVYAAELENAGQEQTNETLMELEIGASASTCEDALVSERLLSSEVMDYRGLSGTAENLGSEKVATAWHDSSSAERHIKSESLEDEIWMKSETMTTEEKLGFGSTGPAEAVAESMTEMTVRWTESDSAYSTQAHYTEEWRPTHGYRGLGSWELTRKAVENACKNQELELSPAELNQGANIWFYSGVTLQFMDGQYGSGWAAFAAWFERVSGEKTPDFAEEQMRDILTNLNRTATSEERPPLSVEAE